MDFTTIQATVAQLKTDVSKFVSDATAKLNALAANQTNPADVQTIADLNAGLAALDDSVTAADAALNPPAPTA